MGLENPVHWVFILVIALVVLGPKRLPEVGRSLGRGIRELKDGLTGGSSDEQRAEPAVEPARAPAVEDRPAGGSEVPSPAGGSEAPTAAVSREQTAAPQGPR